MFNDTDLDAKTSIDEINKVLDTYLPDILTAVNGENNTLGNIGINIDEIKAFDSNGKYDSDAFYAFAGQLSLYLIKMLYAGAAGNAKEPFLKSSFSELYLSSLLKDDNALLDFFTYKAVIDEVKNKKDHAAKDFIDNISEEFNKIEKAAKDKMCIRDSPFVFYSILFRLL